MRARYITAIVTALIALLFVLPILFYALNLHYFKTGQVSINNVTYNAYLAVSPAQQELGLMNRSTIGDCNGAGNCVGMLFVFQNDSYECFWMKNTRIPLRQSWIENGIVTYAANAMPYSTSLICHNGSEVLETNTSLDIGIGTRISYLYQIG